MPIVSSFLFEREGPEGPGICHYSSDAYRITRRTLGKLVIKVQSLLFTNWTLRK
jgi:hypothetical protein